MWRGIVLVFSIRFERKTSSHVQPAVHHDSRGLQARDLERGHRSEALLLEVKSLHTKGLPVEPVFADFGANSELSVHMHFSSRL